MTALLAERTAEVLDAAQQLLAKRMGAPVSLVDPEELGGSGRTVVLRVRVAEHAFSLPRTVIIKKVRDTPASDDLDIDEPEARAVDSAFLREAVSYQFATALALEERPGPELLAVDLDSRMLILSDLGDHASMTDLLDNADDVDARHPLMAYAQALGRMHAATVGREEDFTALLRRAEMAHHTDGIGTVAAQAVEAVPALLIEHLGIETPTDISHTLQRCVKLFDGGRFRAFSPLDLCPDNIIVNDDGVRFLDYEWGGFRDATLDIAYALVSFPGCLCHFHLSRERAQAMVEAWRAEVVGMWPQLADDLTLARKILDAQVVWVWLTTFWFLPDDHARIASVRGHGLSVPRSRALTARWAALAESAAEADNNDIAAFAEQVVAALDAKWSD